LADAKAAYGWPYGAFEIPADVKAAWEAIGARGSAERAEWDNRFSGISAARQAQFNRAFSGEAPKKLAAAIRAIKKDAAESSQNLPRVQPQKKPSGSQPCDARNRRWIG